MRRLAPTVIAAVLVLAALVVYVLRLNGAAGMIVDDAWYVMLAKSLAEGRGYKLISSAAEPILPLYPPGFPALLSIVVRISPDFPQNVPWLKAVSIAAMLGVGLLTYVYVRAHRQLSREMAACLAFATAIVPAFVFTATSTVMSECVFTLAQLAVVVLVHRAVESPEDRQRLVFAIAAGVVTAGAVLIRSAAIGLVVAAMLWLLKERRWKTAGTFVAAMVICLLPWMTYTRMNAPTAEQRAAHGGAVVYDYFDQLSMRVAGGPGHGRVTLADLPARIGMNLKDVFAHDMGGIFAPIFVRTPSESGEEVVSLGASLAGIGMGSAGVTMAISLVWSAIVLVGFVAAARRRMTVVEFLVPIAIAIILLWPFWSFRFMIPLIPFLFFYLVIGLQTLTRSARVARIVLLCIIGLSLYDHIGYILHARGQSEPVRGEWVGNARDVDIAIDWIRGNLGDDGVVATTNPALLYLHTGRRSITYDNPTLPLATWKARGVRYVACLLPLDLPPSARGSYKVLYQSPARLWVIEL
jgi:hypothetical protein